MQFRELQEKGFLLLKGVLDEEIITDLIDQLSDLKPSNAVTSKNESIYGVRDLLNLSPKIRKFSESETVREIAKKFFGRTTKIVRAIYFDKTPNANWKVPWHQDLTIAVKRKRETEGFTAWTQKAGIQHVQPPVEILEKMLTLRFHLDDADESNGALKIIPKTHKSGRLSAEEIKIARKANETVLCSVKKGDCLIMRPLLLHSSSAGLNPQHRRVIHFELAAEDLPNGLTWYDS